MRHGASWRVLSCCLNSTLSFQVLMACAGAVLHALQLCTERITKSTSASPLWAVASALCYMFVHLSSLFPCRLHLPSSHSPSLSPPLTLPHPAPFLSNSLVHALRSRSVWGGYSNWAGSMFFVQDSCEAFSISDRPAASGRATTSHNNEGDHLSKGHFEDPMPQRTTCTYVLAYAHSSPCSQNEAHESSHPSRY